MLRSAWWWWWCDYSECLRYDLLVGPRWRVVPRAADCMNWQGFEVVVRPSHRLVNGNECVLECEESHMDIVQYRPRACFCCEGTAELGKCLHDDGV